MIQIKLVGAFRLFSGAAGT